MFGSHCGRDDGRRMPASRGRHSTLSSVPGPSAVGEAGSIAARNGYRQYRMSLARTLAWVLPVFVVADLEQNLG